MEYWFNRIIVGILFLFILALLLHVFDLVLFLYRVCKERGVGGLVKLFAAREELRRQEAEEKSRPQKEADAQLDAFKVRAWSAATSNPETIVCLVVCLVVLECCWKEGWF